MMRKTYWVVAAALAASSAGCAGPYDQGYGYAAPSYGYGYGSGYSSGYYAPQAYYSSPTVYRETRYVPVPTPVPVPVPQRQVDRSNDHHWDGRHDEPRHVDRQPANPPPPATHNTTSPGSHHDGNRHDGSRDRDNDRRS
jgi:hypothetical protein